MKHSLDEICKRCGISQLVSKSIYQQGMEYDERAHSFDVQRLKFYPLNQKISDETSGENSNERPKPENSLR